MKSGAYLEKYWGQTEGDRWIGTQKLTDVYTASLKWRAIFYFQKLFLFVK